VVKIELLGGVVNDAFDGHMVSCSTLAEILRCFDMIISSIALLVMFQCVSCPNGGHATVGVGKIWGCSLLPGISFPGMPL
jgi:hypothetical protein